MPTPRPIRVASVGEKVAMSIAWASRPVAARPQPSARTAQISGSSVAHREPKAIASTIAAATNPISSLEPPRCCVACWIPLPPSSTWSPSPRASSAVAISLS